MILSFLLRVMLIALRDLPSLPFMRDPTAKLWLTKLIPCVSRRAERPKARQAERVRDKW